MKRQISFILHNLDIKNSLRASLMYAIIVLYALSPFDLKAAFSKHSTSIAEKVTARWTNNNYPQTNLTSANIDGPALNSIYCTGNLSNIALDGTDKRNYINVALKEGGIKESDSGDLVVYVRRTINISSGSWATIINNSQPTEFEVKALYPNPSGENYITTNPVFCVSLQYRGPSTEEYSVRIPISKIFENYPSLKGKTINALRFFVTRTNNDDIYEAKSNKLRETSLNSFDVLKIPHDAPYSDTFADNFHLTTDYGNAFEGYEFVNTQGIADSRNGIAGWDMLDDAEIQRLQGMGITYPDYSFITSASDKKRNPYPLDNGQNRQATHTVEHIIYAMPGDVIPLYPYYGLSHTRNFKENFSHWYEYKSGGIPNYTTPWSGEKVELLDFLTDPSRIQKTPGNGYYGGQYMNFKPEDIIQVSTPEQYAAAVAAINNGKYNAIIELTADLDFTGFDGNQLVICPDWQHHFKGIINGKGHKISNLVVNKPDVETLGLLVTWTDSGVVIENLYIDNTCSIIGKRNVGLVGFHAEKTLIVRNVHTEATVKAINGQAAGIVGTAGNQKTSLILEDCYIGGVIGMDGQSENAAIAGWWRVDGGDCYCSFSNVTVNCKLYGSDGNANRKYVRSDSSSSPVAEGDNGAKIRGYFSFKDCYGNLDKNDETWNYIPSRLEFPAESLAKLGWTDYKTPPMSSTVSNPYDETITIGNEADYITKINNFNANTKTDHRVTIVLTQDLDFRDYGPEDVPMITPIDNKEFAGIFNGAGHTIKNLRIIRDEQNVGMFARTRNGARIENLILDSSCLFQGKSHVGIVGNHRWNPIIFRNVKTEATVRGTDGGEQACAALVGFSNGGYSVGSFDVTNVYIGGVVGNPEDASSGHNNAVICGWQTNSNLTGTLTFTNIVVNCELYGNQNQNRMKYLRHNYPDAAITMEGDTYVRSCTNGNGNPYSFRYTNCFGNIDSTETPWQTMPVITDESKLPVFENWADSYKPGISEDSEVFYLINGNGNGDRSVGTVATFFCPRDPFNKESAQSLPMPAGEDEYIVAADFSQTFNPHKNIDTESKQLVEPIIAFRHIFRIRDGKSFADMISGSVESNRNYLRMTRKYVSARTGANFQIRLENPIPKSNGTKIPPSHYYYVDENGEYRQVAKMGVKVLDGDTRKSTSRMTFQFDNIYPGYGFREIDGVKYALGEGSYLSQDKHPDYNDDYEGTKEAEYYLLLTNKSTTLKGHYLVQIVAQDYNGKEINIKGTNTPLVLMEYDINVLPQDGAWMVEMDELYSKENYRINSPEELDKRYDTQSVKIDFDEYMAINKLPDNDPLKSKLISWSTYNQTSSVSSNPGPDAVPTANGINKTWFKWPRPWEQSTYIFGYNDRFDYSMYQLATHSENVVWKWAAKDFPENSDPTSLKGNNPGDGMGLFDRRYYASKLDKTRSGDIEQGYFYYVNAASDPGVSASLRIDELCQGSRVVVSAWMAEFSTASEKGNLSFNFVAVLNDDVAEKYPNAGFVDGQRVILHKFISGYPQNSGKWYNIYYSFTPRLAEFSSEGVTSDMVDHYELELDNNSRSSNGADYAIDDIRAYIVPPTVEAEQLSPACDNEEIRMQLASPFETLLEIAGKREMIGDETEGMDVYYTYLDKGRFDNIYDEDLGNLKEAFDASIIEFNYNISNEDDRKYGKITFNGNYSKNPTYKGKNADGEVTTPDFGKAYAETRRSGERMIIFESEISSGKLRAGKEYYVLFKSTLDVSETPEDGKEAEFFNMKDPCANTCVVFITPSNVVKIDGQIQSDIENIIICENQAPVVQVNVWGVNDEGERKEVEKNVCFDWFYGTIDEYEAYNNGDGDATHTLQEALYVFRLRYPDAQTLEGIKADEKKKEGEEMLEQWMLDVIRKASSPEESNSFPKLTLYLPSFVMPPVDLKNEENSVVSHVVVLPIACIPAGSYNGDTEYLICSSPTELKMTVGNRGPLLRHGLTGIDYPNDLVDVPLRIGIDHLRNEYFEPSRYERRRVDIPVRLASSYDEKSQAALNLITEKVHYFDTDKNINDVEKEGAVILVQTNDPAYKDLGTVDKNKNEIGTLLWVGEVKKLVATTNKSDSEKYFQVEFDESFNFKEGYFYRFRFQYEEEHLSEDTSVCYGQDVFTLKVVPKYLEWTGESSINWNDDENWKRVGKSDLLISDRQGNNAFAHYISNGFRGAIVNGNVSAYAPLDYTSVIINNGVESPYLYEVSELSEVKDEYDGKKKYIWPSNPEKGSSTMQTDDPGAEGVGNVTPLIHYDMAAFEFEANKGRDQAEIGCRPWYANTCKEIHFKPGGTIMNQQELIYEKAWVDVELDHSRWQTVSTPLQEVYAGDFYLPSDGARQATELYQDINFDNDRKINDRFKPAVFQRGWDKSVAKVYEIDGPAVDAADVRNVAVKTFWSHVYNDVKEEYGGGVGFSIKTDVSAMTKNKPGDEGKVLFRLPKADTEYLYWNKDGSKSGHKTAITRGAGNHRLNDSHGTINAQAAENGQYFLVGNPFMTHMDIKEFLVKNNGKLEPKYWIVTKTGQIAGSVDASGEFVAADPTDPEWSEDPTVIAPMQGFFVRTIAPAEKVELSYDESMMRRYDSRSDHAGEYLTTTTRAQSTAQALKITSYNYGQPSSAALLLEAGDQDADRDVEAMDNRDLDIFSTVYTAKGGKALSINFCGDMEGTEIGVIADDDTETVIRFEGVEVIEGLYLLDKDDHSLTPLEEGMEVNVDGAAAGRFFLTYGIADEGMLSGIEWSVSGGVLTAVDNAASGFLEVNVFDPTGRILKHDSTPDSVISMPLVQGIYVVEIRTAKERKSIKVRI